MCIRDRLATEPLVALVRGGAHTMPGYIGQPVVQVLSHCLAGRGDATADHRLGLELRKLLVDILEGGPIDALANLSTIRRYDVNPTFEPTVAAPPDVAFAILLAPPGPAARRSFVTADWFIGAHQATPSTSAATY